MEHLQKKMRKAFPKEFIGYTSSLSFLAIDAQSCAPTPVFQSSARLTLAFGGAFCNQKQAMKLPDSFDVNANWPDATFSWWCNCFPYGDVTWKSKLHLSNTFQHLSYIWSVSSFRETPEVREGGNSPHYTLLRRHNSFGYICRSKHDVYNKKSLQNRSSEQANF